MTIWLKVSSDRLELPIAVAESKQELARICGVKVNNIDSAMCHARARGYRCAYIKVEVEDDDEELSGSP